MILYISLLISIFLLFILLSEKFKIIDFFTLNEKLEKIKINTKDLPTVVIEYPIFYINMDKDKDRQEYMEKQLSNITREHYRIAGVNGHKINNTESDTVDGLTFKNKYNLTKSEIGCTLSHIKAITTAYKLEKEYAIICEDDVCFDNIKLVEPISEIIKNAPQNWEILQLSIGTTDFDKLEKYYDNSKPKYIEYKDYAGIFCYLINKKGMEKIAKRGFNIVPFKKDFPQDGNADFFIYNSCITYTVVPCLFVVNNTKLESTIHTNHTNDHMIFANKLLDIYLEKSELLR